MRRLDRAGWTIWLVTLLLGAAFCTRPASAAFYLDWSAAGDHEIDLVLQSDTPIASVESIDIELKFDAAVLALIGKPTFEAVLASADFKFPGCGQRLLPGNLLRSNCGGFFDPERASLESGPLVSWLFRVDPQALLPTTFDVSITLGEDEPIVFSKAATLAVPEPTVAALILAGLGLLALQTRRSAYGAPVTA